MNQCLLTSPSLLSIENRLLIPFCPAVATQATETSVPACLAVQACLVE